MRPSSAARQNNGARENRGERGGGFAMTLQETVQSIKKPDEKAMEQCKKRWNSIAKPFEQSGKDGGFSGENCRDDRKQPD